jgi:hypothetical protein
MFAQANGKNNLLKLAAHSTLKLLKTFAVHVL